MLFKDFHGMTRTKEYRIWTNMKTRCYNPRCGAYPRYGGAGIYVCDEWRFDFSQFFMDMGFCPVGMTIDRKNGKLGYSPENCKWSTPIEQSNNRPSVNRVIEHGGKSMTLAQWARHLRISQHQIRNRLRHGHPISVAFMAGSIRNGRNRFVLKGLVKA